MRMLVYYFVDARALQDIEKRRLNVCRIFGLDDAFEFLRADLHDRNLLRT